MGDMAVENGTVQIVISTATIIGGLWIIFQTVYSGYKAFKKDVYDKLGKVVEKPDCLGYREGFEKDFQRIDADVREIRGRK
jgi:hypothetical protein